MVDVVESESVDDLWSFERIAQMRRMADVLPAVILQFKTLGPNDLLPVQFQFSRRRTDPVTSTGVVLTTESDLDEDDEFSDQRTDPATSKTGVVRPAQSDAAKDVETEWDILEKAALSDDMRRDRINMGVKKTDLVNGVQKQMEQKTETEIVQFRSEENDEKRLESVMSNVSLNNDSPLSSVHGRNMRAAASRRREPSNSPPSCRSDSALQSGDESSRAVSTPGRNVNLDVMSANKQELLNRLFVQRLEKQEELLAQIRQSSDRWMSTPDVRYKRHGRSHTDEALDVSNSRRHRHRVSWACSLSDNEGLKNKRSHTAIKVSKNVRRTPQEIADLLSQLLGKSIKYVTLQLGKVA